MIFVLVLAVICIIDCKGVHTIYRFYTHQDNHLFLFSWKQEGAPVWKKILIRIERAKKICV